MEQSKNYIALIADIIESRKVGDRAAFQRRLQSVLNGLNDDRRELVSPYTITIGDEFQAVFDRADRVIKDMLAIITKLHPVRIRFSLGIGSIETDINSDSAIGMDGPAFHLARKGMEKIKRTGECLSVRWADELHERLFPMSSELLPNLFKTVSNKYEIIENWKSNRIYIFNDFYNEIPVKEIADAVGVSPQAVYKTIQKANMLDFKVQLVLGHKALQALVGSDDTPP